MSAKSPHDPVLPSRVLSTPIARQDPWPHFTCADALDREDLRHLEALYARAIGWKRHQTTLYNCVMQDVTADLDLGMREALTRRMRMLTGQSLTDHLQVTAQKMVPGDSIGLHNDRPLLGYEAVRLVIQLSQEWRSEHGGLFQMYGDPHAPKPQRVISPTYNNALGFALSEGSHHSVTEVARERRSIVMSFWHVGSTTELRAHIEDLYARVSLGDLPSELDPVMSATERELPEECSFAAAKVACILHGWGYDVGVVERGYRAACSDEPGQSAGAAALPSEEDVAIELARWAVHLRLEAFDLDRWRRLGRSLRLRPVPRLRGFSDLAFPSP